MAQILPPSPDSPRPLPRPGRVRPASPRAVRPRFQALDALWLAALIVVTVGTNFAVHIPFTLGLTLATAVIIACYLTGWRIAGRACGVVSGLLTASSPIFLLDASHSQPGAAFTLLTVTALLLAIAELPIYTCAAAGMAAVLRPDGLLLGLILLALISVRSPKQAAPGAGVFFLVTAAGWAARLLLAHQSFPLPAFHSVAWPYSWACAQSSLFLLWFLVPFAAEIADMQRGARWTPIALWLAAYALFASFVQFTGAADTALPLMPVLFLAVAGGVARLLPAVAGENPALRHVLATLAILSLLAIRAYGHTLP